MAIFNSCASLLEGMSEKWWTIVRSMAIYGNNVETTLETYVP